MTRMRQGKLLALTAVLLAYSPGGAQDAADVDNTPRQLMRLAVQRALAASGFTLESGSVESGQFVTAPVPLETERLQTVAEQLPEVAGIVWARAEYRLRMGLSIAQDGWMTSGLQAEIRAWPAEPSSPGGSKAGSTTLKSNGTLEGTFMQAIGREIDRIAHLFPPERPESPTAEKPEAAASAK